jgi:hypothetical protein
MKSFRSIFTYVVVALFTFNLGYVVSVNTQTTTLMVAEAAAPTDGIFNSLTFGTSNDTSHWKNNNFDSPKNSKIISGGWVLDSWKYYHTDWLKKFSLPENKDKIPMMYIYTVAGKARAAQGLQDCNVGAKVTLCQSGANFLRKNYQSITKEYQNTALAIKNTLGTSKPILLQMEPDFYQYHNQYGQQNPLTNKEAWDMMNTWTDSIKSILPNARLVMDVSPWANDLQTWSSGFKNFSYAGVVGREYAANADSRPVDGLASKTYKQLSQMTGKQLIINTAHGPAGKLLPYQTTWENRNLLQDRVNDGVVAVIQPSTDNSRFTNFLTTYSTSTITKK